MQGMVTCPQFSVSFGLNQCTIHSKPLHFISTRKYAFAGGKVNFNSNAINMNPSCAGKLSTEGFHSEGFTYQGSPALLYSPAHQSAPPDHQIKTSKYQTQFTSELLKLINFFTLRRKTDFRSARPINETHFFTQSHLIMAKDQILHFLTQRNQKTQGPTGVTKRQEPSITECFMSFLELEVCSMLQLDLKYSSVS